MGELRNAREIGVRQLGYALRDLPDPREADLAGEALDLLGSAMSLWGFMRNEPIYKAEAEAAERCYQDARSILRRAGRM